MPKTDDISRPGISRTGDGRLILRYLGPDGTRAMLDLTAEIERIAAEKVAGHQRDYHGG